VVDRNGVEQHGDETSGLGEIGENARAKPIAAKP